MSSIPSTNNTTTNATTNTSTSTGTTNTSGNTSSSGTGSTSSVGLGKYIADVNKFDANGDGKYSKTELATAAFSMQPGSDEFSLTYTLLNGGKDGKGYLDKDGNVSVADLAKLAAGDKKSSADSIEASDFSSKYKDRAQSKNVTMTDAYKNLLIEALGGTPDNNSTSGTDNSVADNSDSSSTQDAQQSHHHHHSQNANNSNNNQNANNNNQNNQIMNFLIGYIIGSALRNSQSTNGNTTTPSTTGQSNNSWFSNQTTV